MKDALSDNIHAVVAAVAFLASLTAFVVLVVTNHPGSAALLKDLTVGLGFATAGLAGTKLVK